MKHSMIFNARKLKFMKFAFVALMLLGACKRVGDSSLDSGLGLETGKRLRSIAGAPTFSAVSNWFGKFTSNPEGALKQKDSYQLTPEAMKKFTPASQMPGLKAYIDKELKRAEAFRAAVNQNNRAQIEQLLEQESKEIYDIIMVMLKPQSYSPQYGDLFAKFIKEEVATSRGSRSLDFFAQDFLNTVSKEIGPFSTVANDLEKERLEFFKALKKEFLDTAGGLDRLSQDLNAMERSFVSLRNYLSSDNASIGTDYKLDGTVAAFLHYQTSAYGAKKNLPVGQGANSPSDQLLNKEPQPGDGGGGGGNNPNPNPNPPGPNPPSPNPNNQCPGGQELIQCPDGFMLCAPPGSICMMGAPALNANWYSKKWPKQNVASPKQNFSCADLKGMSPQEQITCERYGSYTTPFSSYGAGSDFIDFSDLNTALQQNAGKSSLAIMEKFETPVQDQGQEGACTAFGMAHTIEGVINKVLGGASFTTDAWALWNTYKKPDMVAAANAAKSFSFQSPSGKTVRVGAVTTIRNITELFKALDEGPVWAGSEVNQSWQAAGKGGNPVFNCNPDAVGGHAYSIHGYRVNKAGTAGHLFVKNSWGSGWGDNGFALLPMECFSTFQNLPFEAHTVQAN